MYKIKVMRSEGLEIKAIKILQQDFVLNPRNTAEANSSSMVAASGKNMNLCGVS